MYVITCNKTEWCVWNLFWTYALCNFICSFVWCKTSWNFSILRLNIYRRSPEFLLFDIMLVDMTLNMKNIYIFAKHFVRRTAYLLYEGAIRKFKIWYFLTFNEVLQEKEYRQSNHNIRKNPVFSYSFLFVRLLMSSNLKEKENQAI